MTRADWRARSPKSTKPLRQNPPPFVVVHHSDTPSCFNQEDCKKRIRNIQDYHMDHNNWQDIGYNFLVSR